mmetsp:Transcript_32987/g.72482  ORF Transcript_32987/g.72482 Transcript_32987/m.72482 type:complete len:211 (+) Transcript_32987:295-927(+)
MHSTSWSSSRCSGYDRPRCPLQLAPCDNAVCCVWFCLPRVDSNACCELASFSKGRRCPAGTRLTSASSRTCAPGVGACKRRGDRACALGSEDRALFPADRIPGLGGAHADLRDASCGAAWRRARWQLDGPLPGSNFRHLRRGQHAAHCTDTACTSVAVRKTSGRAAARSGGEEAGRPAKRAVAHARIDSLRRRAGARDWRVDRRDHRLPA